ncbi:hypothetical protein F7725_025987 [Dissostichus mawsoni]|uniref:Uncharacterized protein n=1 Tax=Dissostichus mawsoni TaxID=36200 RepID=A0A7J5X5T9_DISMA|nr:hypothetical protein F7725_025987 [Dissostichus mawsoni]
MLCSQRCSPRQSSHLSQSLRSGCLLQFSHLRLGMVGGSSMPTEEVIVGITGLLSSQLVTFGGWPFLCSAKAAKELRSSTVVPTLGREMENMEFPGVAELRLEAAHMTRPPVRGLGIDCRWPQCANALRCLTAAWVLREACGTASCWERCELSVVSGLAAGPIVPEAEVGGTCSSGDWEASSSI